MKKGILALSFCLVSSFSVSNVAVAQETFNRCETMFNQMFLLASKSRAEGITEDTVRKQLDSLSTNPDTTLAFHKQFDIAGKFVFDLSDKEYMHMLKNSRSAIEKIQKKVDELGLCD